MRYQGDITALGETEWRWDFTYRHSLVGFGGAGKAIVDGDRFQDSFGEFPEVRAIGIFWLANSNFERESDTFEVPKIGLIILFLVPTGLNKELKNCEISLVSIYKFKNKINEYE